MPPVDADPTHESLWRRFLLFRRNKWYQGILGALSGAGLVLVVPISSHLVSLLLALLVGALLFYCVVSTKLHS